METKNKETYSLRKKGKYANGDIKWIVERKLNSQTIETRTLIIDFDLWEYLRPDKKGIIASQSIGQQEINSSQKYGYELLSEQSKEDFSK